MITERVKKPSTRARVQAPMVGIHFPTRNETIAATTETQMNTSAKRYCHSAGQRREELAKGRDGEDRQRAADPDRVGDPVQHRIDRRDEAAEGQPRPHVGAALLRESRAELRRQQRVGEEEENGQEDEPGKRLWPLARRLADRVHADQRADEEEQDIEAPKVLL